jgi:hypothetical protein
VVQRPRASGASNSGPVSITTAPKPLRAASRDGPRAEGGRRGRLLRPLGAGSSD